MGFLGVKFSGPFLAEKPQMWVPIWIRGSEDFKENEGKSQKIGR